MTIADIAEYVQRGKSPKYAESSELPVVNQKCVRWDQIQEEHLKFVTPSQWPKWAAERFLRPGDVLWNSTGTGTIGRAALYRGLRSFDRAVCDSHVTVVRVREYDPALLHAWIRSPAVQSKIDRMQSGSTNQVELSKGEVLDTSIPVPPLSEQRRIVEALDSYLTRLDDVVATLERVQRNLKRYRASVLKAAVEGRLVPTEAELARKEGRDYEPADVLLQRILGERKARWIEDAAEKARDRAEKKAKKAGEPWSDHDDQAALEKGRKAAAKKYEEPEPPDTREQPGLPEGWVWTSLYQLADVIAGWGFPKRLQGRPEGDLPFYKVGDISRAWQAGQDYLTQADHYVTQADLEVLKATPLPAGATVFAKIGAAIALNRRAILSRPSLIDNNAFAVAPMPSVHHEFLFYVLCATGFGEAARATTVPSLRKGDVGLLPVALPPAREQLRIVEALGTHLSSERYVEQTTARDVAKAERTRQAILKWAFEGRLVDQDPTDEPASVLLERIAAEREESEINGKKERRRKARKKTTTA